MLLTEENYIERIYSYSSDKWKPLFDLIPYLERKENNKASLSFSKIVYDIPIIIVFDWLNWAEGNKILKDENFNFDSIDIPTKCKIISSIIRSNRFNEGLLDITLEDGTLLKILKSIKQQLST